MNGADKVRHTLRLNGELWSRCIDRKNHSIIEAGCIREFTRMSYPEMGAMLGTSHTTALDRVKRFNALPWRERYAWLSLVAETVGIGDHGVRNLNEIERLRKERDEARREVCEFELVNMKQAYEYATHRGWDCYKEKTQ